MQPLLQTDQGATPLRRLSKNPEILIATDGSAQSAPAVEFVRLLFGNESTRVRVITVVDHPLIPWGGVDRGIVLDYERSLQAEALAKAKSQVGSAGGVEWSVEVQTGDAAERIAGLAREMDAKLVVVGLGGHGPAARLFGSETALRLIRISHTPVLAVAPPLRALPGRMVVGMDFTEASIKAARLALEIAAPDATLVLAHVVPWEKKEYIPEEWFRSHENKVGAELSRVARWLHDGRNGRTAQRILYGRPPVALLALAEELGADLLVAGTHGRGAVGRLAGGQTVAKLIRGARCSVLVLPVGAAFR